MENMKDLILYSQDEGIAKITLNRPESLNALNLELLLSLSETLDKVKVDQNVKAVIITGAGEKIFSVGADIKLLHSLTPLEVRDLAKLAVEITHKIESLGKVVVAAINGTALGGGLEIAEACMLRIAASHAQLGHPEVRIGAVAGFGGTTRLPRLIGKGRAAELLLTGNSINAEQAYNMGLVNKVVEPGKLLIEAENMIRGILSQSPMAVKLTWEALHHGLNLTLEESAQLDANYFGLVASTEDFKIGTKSFIDKTTPVYSKITNKEHVIQVAAQLFLKNGNTSMDEVMKISKVSKSNIYYHFKNKEDLQLAVVKYWTSLYESCLIEALKQDYRPVRERLSDFTEFLLGGVIERNGVGNCPFISLYIQSSEQSSEVKDAITLFFREIEPLVIKIFKQGKDNNEFNKTVHPRQMALLFLSTLEGSLILGEMMKDPILIKQTIDNFFFLLD